MDTTSIDRVKPELEYIMFLYNLPTVESREGDMYMEVSRVRNDIPSGAIPLNDKIMAAIGRKFYKSFKKTKLGLPVDMIPDNMIYFVDEVIAWYEPSMTRTVFYGTSKKQVSLLFPGIVYIVQDDAISYFAYDDTKPLRMDTMLYLYPLPNTFGTGHMCHGNVKLPKGAKIYKPFMQAWQNVIWNSIYTGAHGNQLIKGNLFSVYEGKEPTYDFTTKNLRKWKTLGESLGL
jgi:PRTRC genetic system protein B